ncbi:hypothetical protein B0H65DRAFT_510082 [Neurospora tetraspora]|uniref:G domain-containing protein n=1 Tax=Neurospora tetraspora TaxID=94610 RepID=A0AAE0JEQ9_9PEZI|nr:hypothetical protein B0H65DRAFT_510082 [Neurospora tetraspora]
MSTISESHHATKFEPRPTDIIVAVMGMTGSGKSTFISHCVGVDLGIVGHGLQGYSEVLKAIGVWMGDTYSKNIKLNGIIYLHRITDPRMVGSAKKNLFIFKKLCGQNALKHVTLATTMWEAVQPSDGERRERELLETQEFWGYMQSKGADVERHYNNRESAMRILSKFFTEEQVVTTLQRELVEGKKEVLDTAAGMELNSEYRVMEENLKRELQRTVEDLKEAQKAKDEESARELEKYRKQVDDKIAQVLRDREDLKVTLAKMLATSTFPIVSAPGSFNHGARGPGGAGNAGRAEAGRPGNPDSEWSYAKQQVTGRGSSRTFFSVHDPCRLCLNARQIRDSGVKTIERMCSAGKRDEPSIHPSALNGSEDCDSN